MRQWLECNDSPQWMLDIQDKLKKQILIAQTMIPPPDDDSDHDANLTLDDEDDGVFADLSETYVDVMSVVRLPVDPPPAPVTRDQDPIFLPIKTTPQAQTTSDDESDDEIKVMTEEEVKNDPEMSAEGYQKWLDKVVLYEGLDKEFEKGLNISIANTGKGIGEGGTSRQERDEAIVKRHDDFANELDEAEEYTASRRRISLDLHDTLHVDLPCEQNDLPCEQNENEAILKRHDDFANELDEAEEISASRRRVSLDLNA